MCFHVQIQNRVALKTKTGQIQQAQGWRINRQCAFTNKIDINITRSIALSHPGLCKVVRKSFARCGLDFSCTTFSSGVVGSDCFFCMCSRDLGRCWRVQIWIQDLPAYKFWHSWHSLSAPFKKCRYSQPVRTNTCAMYDSVCCLLHCLLFLCRCPDGLGGENPAGLAQGLQMHQYIYPVKLWNVWYWYCLPTMCHCICRCKLTCQTRCAMGPTFGLRDVYTLLPTLCHCILLFESLKIYYNIEKVFWYVLVDFSRDAWLHAFELCSWGCLTLDGHACLTPSPCAVSASSKMNFPSQRTSFIVFLVPHSHIARPWEQQHGLLHRLAFANGKDKRFPWVRLGCIALRIWSANVSKAMCRGLWMQVNTLCCYALWRSGTSLAIYFDSNVQNRFHVSNTTFLQNQKSWFEGI